MRRLYIAAIAALTGCSVPAVTPDEGIEDELFPHALDFGEPGQHGQAYLGEYATACAGCHDAEAADDAETLQGAAGCRSCHAGYPHLPGWLEAHGASWADPETGSTCAACHGEDLSGGASSVACDSCHASWPHPAQWDVATGHGAFLGTRGTLDSCLSCHVTEALGETAETPGCGDCHADYPHVEDWATRDLHGAAWQSEDECGTCHGPAGEGGAWAPACATCHATYPHAEGWITGHPASVAPAGEAQCALCHEPGVQPPDLPVSCAAVCHGAAL